MKDLFGVELKVGQLVGFTTKGRYNYTMGGEIVGFTPKMVKVLHKAKFGGNEQETSLFHPLNLTVSVLSKDETNE